MAVDNERRGRNGVFTTLPWEMDISLPEKKRPSLYVIGVTLALTFVACGLSATAEFYAPTDPNNNTKDKLTDPEGPAGALGLTAIFALLVAMLVPTISYCGFWGLVQGSAGNGRSAGALVLLLLAWTSASIVWIMLAKAVSDEWTDNKELPDGRLQDIDPLPGVFFVAGVFALFSGACGAGFYWFGTVYSHFTEP